jgi:hypothetical protein
MAVIVGLDVVRAGIPTIRTIGRTLWHLALCSGDANPGGVVCGGVDDASSGNPSQRCGVDYSCCSWSRLRRMGLDLVDVAPTCGFAGRHGVFVACRRRRTTRQESSVWHVHAVGHLPWNPVWCSFLLPLSSLCAAERVCNTLTIPLVVYVQLAWWAMRNISALVWMALVAVCGAARVAGATGAAKRVQTIGGSFYKSMMQAVGCLGAVRVVDLVSAVVAPALAACKVKATVLLPVAVEDAAPSVETEAMQEVEVSTVHATVVSEEVPVEAARTKSKVTKDVVQPRPRRRTRPAPESQAEPRRSKRIADRGGR